MYTDRVFGTAKCVHFIEVSSLQSVINKGFHCTYTSNTHENQICVCNAVHTLTSGSFAVHVHTHIHVHYTRLLYTYMYIIFLTRTKTKSVMHCTHSQVVHSQTCAAPRSCTQGPCLFPSPCDGRSWSGGARWGQTAVRELRSYVSERCRARRAVSACVHH